MDDMETSINIQLVHGGFIFTSPNDGTYKTEVFTSQAKLMKAIRATIEQNALVSKTEKADKTKDAE